jgi:hypothetical protein
MALLDLQMLEAPAETSNARGNSGASKGCNNSILSLLLC